MRIDLFLGGPLGLWVLNQVATSQVGTVYTVDEEIAKRAYRLGVGAYMGDANEVRPSAGGLGLSVHYPRIFKREFLGQYRRIYNIHPAPLPWGRCYYPVFWALWNDEPAGCSLHLIDEGIDSGDIVDQVHVESFDWDTGGSLHRRVQHAEQDLFLEYWPAIAEGVDLPHRPQGPGGSFHRKADFFRLKRDAQCGTWTATMLLRLIRCLSHEDYTGLEIEMGGRRYEISARPL